MRKYLVLLTIFTYGLLGAGAQETPTVDKTRLPQVTTARSVNYWFDGNVADIHSLSALSGTQTIDCSTLVEGLHTLHFQLIDTEGGTASVGSTLFYRINPTADTSAKSLRYWFDGDETVSTLAATNAASTIDVNSLTEGLHTFHCQIIAADDRLSNVSSAIFMKLNDPTNANKASKLSYWFDSETTVKTGNVTTGLQTIDATSLSTGLHTLHYQIVNGLGIVTPPTSALFLKIDESQTEQASTISYWFDEDFASAKKSPVTDIVKIIDAEKLTEGPHALHYLLESADGKMFPIGSVAFERSFFDIYIKESTEYNAETISSDPLFMQNPWMKLHYSAEDTNVRGRLTVDAGTTLSLGKYVQAGHLGKYNSDKFSYDGIWYYHPTTLINQGFMRSDSVKVTEGLFHDRWHFISLPFNANVSNIDMPDNTYWALRRYDGEARAAGDLAATWQNLRKGDTMEAGKGYILQLTREGEDESTSLTFKAENDTHKNDIFISDDAEVSLTEHQSEFAHNRGWNFVGNPYPSFFDTRFIEPGGSIIVWNGNAYDAYSLTDDQYVLMPFEAFFIQKPLGEPGITFAAEGRQHTHEVREIAPARVRHAAMQADRQILNISVSDGRQTDRTRLVINEQASAAYEADKDAPKFFVGQNGVEGNGDDLSPTIQIYSVEAGVKYAINERPLGDGYATLSLLVPESGDYSLLVDGHQDLLSEMAILDTETGRTWTVADGPLTFNASAGRHDARFVVAFNGSTTGIGQQCLTSDGEIGVTDGLLTFRLARESSVKVYAADGRLLYSTTGTNGSVKLDSGFYLINVNKKTTKIIVK